MRLMFGRTRTKRALQRGVAAIEFALILPFLTIIVLAMIDYGYFFYIGINATEAARSAATSASTTAAGMNAGAGVANCSDPLIPTVMQDPLGAPAQAVKTYMGNSVNTAIKNDTTTAISCTMVLGKPAWGVVVTVDFPPASGTVHFGLPVSTTTPGHLLYQTPILYRQ